MRVRRNEALNITIIMKSVTSSLKPDQIVRLLFIHRAKTLGYIWSLVRDFDVAEDIFQEVSVLALEKASTIKDERHLLNWMRTSARLISMATMRKLGRRPVPLDASLLDQLDTAWQTMDTNQTDEPIEALNWCLQKLTKHARQIIDLRYREGLTGTSLGDAMGQSLNTVYVALSRIHRRLRDCVRGRLLRAES